MLTLHVVPYGEIAGVTSVGRIRKLLNLAKENKIVLLEGRLRKEEEAELIKTTMEEINREFKGIELAVIDQIGGSGVQGVMGRIGSFLLGDRAGLTIIGPATVVKAIRKDPHKIELYTEDRKRRKR